MPSKFLERKKTLQTIIRLEAVVLLFLAILSGYYFLQVHIAGPPWAFIYVVNSFSLGLILLLTLRQYQKLLLKELQKAKNQRSAAITKHKQIEEIIKKSPSAVFLWRNEENGPIIDYTHGNVIKLFGYSSKDFLSGRVSYHEIIHPDDLNRVTEEVAHYSNEKGRTEFSHKPYRVITTEGEIKWLDAHTTITRDENDEVLHFLSVIIDSTEKQKNNHLIENIAAGVASETGTEFLGNLVLHIASTLEMKYAMVVQINPEQQCQTLIMVKDGQISKNLRYTLKGTPCEKVFLQGTCCYPSHIKDQFPDDEHLRHLDIESYIGISLRSPDKQTFGLLVAMDNKPLQNQKLATSVLEIFAARTTAELERVEKENQLQLSANILANITEGVVVTDLNANIIAVNKSTTEISGYDEEELIGRNPNLWKSQHHDISFYETLWSSLLTTGNWRGEIWNRRKNGEVFPAQVTITPLRNKNGEVTNYVSVFSDISLVKKSQKKMEHLAQYDQLTNLPNRRLLNDRLKKALAIAERQKEPMAVMLLDLDNFKEVNDSFGHKSGDYLLIEVAQRIQQCIRESDTAARLGGDEFVVLLVNCKDADNVSHIAKNILHKLIQPFDIEGKEIFISTSIGITMFPDDGCTAERLLKNADTAMYHVKNLEKNNFHFFTDSMQKRIVKRLDLISKLRLALQKNQFLLHYQPKINLATGKISGMEALVRWQHSDGTMTPPNDFIPLAEETGLTLPLGLWILRQACKQGRIWQQEGLPPLRLSVNLTTRQFYDVKLLETIEAVLQETGMEVGFLELEITESIIMQDVDKTIKTLWELRDLGILLSVDDFGTGYSSLNHLKRLPVDILKIDRSFIQDITIDPSNKAIVKAIVSLSHHLKMKVVAEGVETNEHLEFLKKIHCHEVQGFHISRPLAAEDFKRFVQKYNKTL